MRGRPPKTTDQHKRDRTFRAARHSARVANEDFSDTPERPADLTADELAVWTLVVETSPDGIVRAIDATQLAGCCYWFGEYNKAMQAMRAMKVTQKAYYRLSNLAAAAWKHFAAAASRFGMTPADRARLKFAPKADKPDDPLEALKLIGAKSA